MGEAVLFSWPPNAAFGRSVPKTKFYEQGNIPPSLREKFVDEIHRITWAYKLADDTIRLRGTTAVPEIEVFVVEAKGVDVSGHVLTAIDKAVHFPIIFEVASGDRVRTVAARKLLHGKAPTIGTYFTTDWQPAGSARRQLPTSLDLPSLYEAILGALLPIATRAGEKISEATKRVHRAQKLQREIGELERKLRIEPQFNRKIEIRKQIKELATTLNELTDPLPSNKE